MPLIVMVVGPALEMVASSVLLVAACLLPLTCMAAADSMVTTARCRRRLARKTGGERAALPWLCCWDRPDGYSSSEEEEEAEEAAAEPQQRLEDTVGSLPPLKAASANRAGFRQRLAAEVAAREGGSPRAADLPPKAVFNRALSH